MFILPYFIKEKTNSSAYSVQCVSFFLEKGGTQLLSLENCSVEDFCRENDLVALHSFKKGNICFVRISPEKTNMKAFYSFHEKVAEGLEVWRSFLWVIDQQKNDVWTVNEKLKDILISNTSIYFLVDTIQKKITV
jgi:hypothetical protein